MAKKFFGRTGTKIEQAVGQCQKTEYDEKIQAGIKRFKVTKECIEKIVNGINEKTPSVANLSKSEKLSQVLRQTSILYSVVPEVSTQFSSLADALNAADQAERRLHKNLAENCYPNFTKFLHTAHPAFKHEKSRLDNKILDMDGAKNKNQKFPKESHKLQAQEEQAISEYEQQRQILEGMIDDIPNHDAAQAGSIRAFIEAGIEFHTTCAQQFNNAAGE